MNYIISYYLLFSFITYYLVSCLLDCSAAPKGTGSFAGRGGGSGRGTWLQGAWTDIGCLDWGSVCDGCLDWVGCFKPCGTADCLWPSCRLPVGQLAACGTAAAGVTAGCLRDSCSAGRLPVAQLAACGTLTVTAGCLWHSRMPVGQLSGGQSPMPVGQSDTCGTIGRVACDTVGCLFHS